MAISSRQHFNRVIATQVTTGSVSQRGLRCKGRYDYAETAYYLRRAPSAPPTAALPDRYRTDRVLVRRRGNTALSKLIPLFLVFPSDQIVDFDQYLYAKPSVTISRVKLWEAMLDVNSTCW